MIEAMRKELYLLNKSNISNSFKEQITTIYFGGGTPSILPPDNIKKLLDTINLYYEINKDAEITLEANPDDIEKNKLIEWKLAGINRLSIGIQSLNNSELKWMNRVHTAEEGLEAIQKVKEAGFTNFSVDLIYGTPKLNNQSWKEDLQRVIELNAPHMACYALTVEPATALFKMIQLNKKRPIDNDLQAEQFKYLMKLMDQSGYEHYEISNFSKPGFRSKHNSSYWKGIKYIGIGPSAHSYDGDNRRWNINNNSVYINKISENILPFENEILTNKDKFNEFVMVRLRMIEGVNITELQRLFGNEMQNYFLKGIDKFINKGELILNGNNVILTNDGKLFADAISSQLFFL